MSSFQIWYLLQVSKKLTKGQQRAEKAIHFEKIQLGERLATNEVSWHQGPYSWKILVLRVAPSNKILRNVGVSS